MKPNAKARAVLFNGAKASFPDISERSDRFHLLLTLVVLSAHRFHSPVKLRVLLSCSRRRLLVPYRAQSQTSWQGTGGDHSDYIHPLPPRMPAILWKFRVWKESCNKYPKKITGCVIQSWVSGKENICAGSWNHIPDIWLRAVSYSQQRLFIRGRLNGG